MPTRSRGGRARRRMRLFVTALGVLSVAAAVWGGFDVVATGSQLLLWTGVVSAVMAALVLRRMSRVGARSVLQSADAAHHVTAPLQDVPLLADERAWQPRDLPRPLTASAGSRAAAVLDAEAARQAVRRAAVEEEMRRRAEAHRPPSIEPVRAARAKALPRTAFADDAEIEAHVRDMLARRAVGE